MLKKRFAENYDNKEIDIYTLSDEIEVEISTLGATLLSIKTPDRRGVMVDVLLGFRTAEDMIHKSDYMGSVVGRFGNRIGEGRFQLEGKQYQLELNDGGKAHLHGGKIGFNQKVFTATEEDGALLLNYCSPHGEEGYPGNLKLTVKYTVKGKALMIEYYAETDATTICNPTNHAYFNLNGEEDGSILDNVMLIRGEKYLPIDRKLIPTGEERSVKGTPFDFSQPKPIGQDIGAEDEQLAIAGGYDHNYCLNEAHFATVYSEKTGIQMDCYTDRPGVQFYSGNFLSGKRGKSIYSKHAGFCLETQLYPDCINKPKWQSPVLKKGDTFNSRTEYCFSIREND